MGMGPNPFRFKKNWANEEACEDVIAIVWEFGGPELDSKLSFCAGELRE